MFQAGNFYRVRSGAIVVFDIQGTKSTLPVGTKLCYMGTTALIPHEYLVARHEKFYNFHVFAEKPFGRTLVRWIVPLVTMKTYPKKDNGEDKKAPDPEPYDNAPNLMFEVVPCEQNTWWPTP